ncbi:integral membrane protein [Apiospora phragmitis]|uniref:Integral membrane protein n=1 Tax=Apiospora phragmitis TaxID=2905665 RepID=A0ABR1WQZ1_9PEZI
MSIANGVAIVSPAPGGYIVDLDHPRSQADVETYWIVAAGNALALLILGQWLWTKIAVLKEFRLEDVCLVLAWIASIGTQAVLVYMFATGILGVHSWTISASDNRLYNIMILVVPLIYAFCAGLAKLSILLYYHQLSPQVWFRRSVIATIIVVLGYTPGTFFSLIFGCYPVAKSWDATITDGTCIDRDALYFVTGILNIATNASILALPIPAKAGLLIMFVIGGLTVATSVMRLVVFLPVLSDQDQPWAMAYPSMWTCVEANLLIICTALPTLRRFFRYLAPDLIGDSGYDYDDEDRERLTPSPGPGGGAMTSKGEGKGKGKQRSGRHRHCYHRFFNNDSAVQQKYPMRSLMDLRPDAVQTVETRAGANSRCSRMWDARPVKSDGDSEKAIFQTWTMTVTYQTREGMA